MGEKEGEKERIQVFLLRSLEFCRSEFIEPRTKVHHLDEGYTCVQKMRSFTEDPTEEIMGNQIFRVKEVFLRLRTFYTTLQEVGIILTWFYFYPLG